MWALTTLAIITSILYGFLYDGTWWKLYGYVVAAYFILTQVLPYYYYNNNLRRKLVMISWDQPSDPQCFTVVEFDCTKTLEYYKKMKNNPQGERITITTLFAMGVAHAMEKNRKLIGRLPFGNFKIAKHPCLTVLVDREGGKDLVPITVSEPAFLSLTELAEELNRKIGKARSGKDKTHKKINALPALLPTFLLKPIGELLSYLAVNCGIWLPGSPLKQKNFGHFVITNVGTLNIEKAFAPICPPV